MTKHILVATDGSDLAQRATRWAARLAGALGIDLQIAHVLLRMHGGTSAFHVAESGQPVPDESLLAFTGLSGLADQAGKLEEVIAEHGQAVLEHASRIAREAGAKNVNVLLCNGDCADELLALAEEDPPEMLVLGSHGLGTIRGLLLGGVTQAVLHHARCPVLVVR